MKLSGEEYRNYWRERMAKGADQVGYNGEDADAQGEIIWEAISPAMSGLNPRSVFEFGCGYGRMLKKLFSLWPSARFYGVDICPEALKHIADNAAEYGNPKLSERIPRGVHVDLVFDCLALQHVTDKAVLADVIAGFEALLPFNRGTIVLFENISETKAEHMLDYAPDQYEALWPSMDWQRIGPAILGYQEHMLMIGRKR